MRHVNVEDVARIPGGVDLTDLDLFADGFPHEVFTRLRSIAPVLWHEPTSHTPDGEGFWSVHTHAACMAVVHDPGAFSSETGGTRPFGGTTLNDLPVAGLMLNMMDDPRHQRVRLLVSKGLTPRTVARLEAELRKRTALLVDAAIADGECDFVSAVAGELPMQAICILMGIPEADRHQLFEWIEHVFDFKGRDAFEATDEATRAAASMFQYGTALVAEKRAHPADDMLSVVCHAELAGEDPPRLTDQELQFFFSLLWAAGADTTRNAIAGAIVALDAFPGEWRALRRAGPVGATAVEEIVRWTHPAAYNRRTATRDLELFGETIHAGDKVVFWEASANRDADVFADPFRFDLGRDPNPHLGFGHGVHHCLGANLARLEIRVVLDELGARVGDIGLTGPVEWTRSNKHTGIRRLPVRLTSL
ncbi:MAG TPA: cytochrome P450 [Acidimicrobiia bacterium]|nr:cytochrome P450 [Acidimicrobiia bacterium]